MSFVVRSGNTELAKHCLEMFVDKFDHHEEDGSNYLHLACWYGHTDIANLLIDKYIELKMTEELTKENNKSESPLANAVMGGIDGSTLMRLVPFYERNTTNLIDRLKYWMANTWEMVKRDKDLIDILKRLTHYENGTNKYVAQNNAKGREEESRLAVMQISDQYLGKQEEHVPAVENSAIHDFTKGRKQVENEALHASHRDMDLNGYNSNCIRELNEYLSDMPSGRVSEWFYDTKLHVSSLFQWEPSPPSRNRLKELITKLWVRVNKLIDDLVTIQDPANRDTTCEGHLAALIGSNPDLALEMFLSTWIYTSHEFYVASSFRTTLSSFVRGEDNDSVKERVKFMHPLLYYLRQMLMRLHTEFRIQRRGEKEMKPEMMGDKIAIPTFMSTSGSLAMALAFSNTCVLMVLGSGASIREVSAPPSEDEYLFRPGISYRVLKVFNPSMLRLLGCKYDLAVLIQESAGRSYVEKRETEIRLIREASVEMINILYKGFESRYVEPRFQKSMSCVGEQVDLNKIKERFNNKEEMRPLLLQADGGGGKTSAVIRLAKDLSESKSEDEKRLPFFPIYVSMMCIENAFKEHAIDDYIMSQCLTSICTVHNILKQFVLVVVLDSFDEGLGIGEAATADGKQQTLLELNPTLLAKSWVVVTCRTERLTRRGLTPSSLLGGSIDSYFLLPFDISQKEELAEKFAKVFLLKMQYKRLTKDKVIDNLKAQGLWYDDQSPQLLYMAVLTMGSINQREKRTISKIYETFLKDYIKTELEKQYPDSELETRIAEVIESAKILARGMLVHNKWTGELSTLAAEDKDTVNEDVKFMPVYFEGDIVRFHHKTLGEFLCAEYIAGLKRDELRELLSERSYSKTDSGVFHFYKLGLHVHSQFDNLLAMVKETKKKDIENTKKANDDHPNTDDQKEKVIGKDENKMNDEDVEKVIAGNALSLLVSSGCTLYGEDLSKAVIEEASFSDGCLVNTNLESSQLNACNFKRCVMINCNLNCSQVDEPAFDQTLPTIHSGKVSRSIFTPCGTMFIVSSGMDPTIKLYHTNTGEEVKKVFGTDTEKEAISFEMTHKSQIKSIACNNGEGKDFVIATCTDASDKREALVTLWRPFHADDASKEDVGKQCAWYSLELRKGSVVLCDLAFSTIRSHLAVSSIVSSEPVLSVYDFRSEKEEKLVWSTTKKFGFGYSGNVKFTHKLDRLVYSLMRTIVIYEYKSEDEKYIISTTIEVGQLGAIIAVPPKDINKSDILFASLVGNCIKVWTDKLEWRVVIDYVQQDKEIVQQGSLAISHCGEYIALGRKGGVDVISLSKKKVVHRYEGHSCDVKSTNYSVKGNIVTSGCSQEDETVRLWSPSGETRHRQEGHKDLIKHLSLNSKQKIVVSGCEGGQVVVWDYEHGSQIRRMPAHTKPIIGLFLTDEYLVTASENELNIYSTSNYLPAGDEVKVEEIKCLAVSVMTDPKKIKIITTNNTNEMMTISNYPKGEQMTIKMEGKATDIACSSTHVAAVIAGKIYIGKLSDKQEVSFKALNFDFAAAIMMTDAALCGFSSCGTYFFCNSKGKQQVWKQEQEQTDDEWKHVGEHPSSDTPVRPISLFVVSSSDVTSLTPFGIPKSNSTDLEFGGDSQSKNTNVPELGGHHEPIQAIAQSEDGCTLVSASRNIHIWNMSPESSKWELKYFLGEKDRFLMTGDCTGMLPVPSCKMFESAAYGHMGKSR
eukprot:TRINITY_DN696_c0_g1_i16.p1 TRINITY_DN696_c0_g1~~TRINITY_DN696_c0_g1_i16.p1  ORF type:complete len:1880 (+),score=368.31 TRINITY_DN696_c0_g1_i16:530-5641(+)